MIELSFQIASKRLDDFYEIFILEDENFENNVHDFFMNQNWKWKNFIWKNKKKHNKQLNFSKSIIEDLKNLNQWDLKLYELATKKFEKNNKKKKETGIISEMLPSQAK